MEATNIGFSDLFERAAILALHRGEWRARLGLLPGDIRVEWSGAEVERAMYLGAHRLADCEAFERIHKAANAAERLVERNSLPFPLIPGARYLESDRLETITGELVDLRREFEAAADEFCNPDVFARMKAAQLCVISDALAKLLKPLGYPGIEDGSADGAIAHERAYARISAGYPAPAECRGRFSLTWQVFSLASTTSAVVAAVSGEAAAVRGIIGGMVEGLRAELVEKVQAVLDLASKGRTIGKRTVESALETVRRVEDLNGLMGDALVADKCRELRRLFASIESAGELVVMRGLASVAVELKADAAAAVSAAVSNLTNSGRRRFVA